MKMGSSTLRHSLTIVGFYFQLVVTSAFVERCSYTSWQKIGARAVGLEPPTFFGIQASSTEEELPSASLEKCFPEKDPSDIVCLVEDKDSISKFNTALNEQQLLLDNNGITLVGIDCEWRPDTLAGPTELRPVMTLQLCLFSLGQVFVLDMKTLTASAELTLAVSEPLSNLWLNPKFVKVGYQHQQDFLRLAASYPEISAFREVNAVLDIKPLARKVIQISGMKKARLVEESLSRMASKFMECRINKEQQMSDWAKRPLAWEQLEYAALDSTVPVVLLERLMDLGQLHFFPSLGREEKDKVFGKLIACHRFNPISSGQTFVSETKVKLRSCLEYDVIWQEWPASSEAPVPATISEV